MNDEEIESGFRCLQRFSKRSRIYSTAGVQELYPSHIAKRTFSKEHQRMPV